MPMYRVGLIQTVVEESTVFIEAPSREEAERLALAKANDGEVEWNFLEAPDPVHGRSGLDGRSAFMVC